MRCPHDVTAADFLPLMGLTYNYRGCGAEGCSCWTFVAVAYEEILGLEVPAFRELHPTEKDAEAIRELVNELRAPWPEVTREDLQPMDVILFNEGAAIGLVCTPDKFLICAERYGGVKAERIDDSYWAYQTWKYHRHPLYASS